MKISNNKFQTFLKNVIQERMERNQKEYEQLQELMNQLDDGITNEYAAERWVQSLRDRADELITIRQITEECEIHRNAVAKITYDLLSNNGIKQEVNILPGLCFSAMNIYYKDVYLLWKMIRDDERYPECGKLERNQLMQYLPKGEQQYLK